MNDTLQVLGFSLADDVSVERIDQFRRLEPGINLPIDEEPLDHPAVLAAIAAGDAPDVVYLDRDVIGAYAVRNALLPLDALMSRDGVELSQFRDAPLRHVTFRGAIYGIPEFHDIHVLFVHNAALVSVLGHASDIEFGDWVRLPEMNVALTHRLPPGLRRVGVDTGLPELLPIWAKANGADLLSADGRTAQFDDPRVVEALETAMRMIEAQGGWRAVSAHRDRLDFFSPDNPFASDQVAVMPMEASYLDVLAEQSSYLEFLVKPIVDRHALPLSWSHGMAWAIPRGAADPETSWRFIRTVSSPDAWLAGAKARMAAARAANRRFEALYTGNKVADAAIWSTVYEPSGQPFFDQAVQAIRFIQETGFVVPPNAAPLEVRAAWIAGTRRALRGNQQPAAALREANAVAQAALDAAG